MIIKISCRDIRLAIIIKITNDYMNRNIAGRIIHPWTKGNACAATYIIKDRNIGAGRNLNVIRFIVTI